MAGYGPPPRGRPPIPHDYEEYRSLGDVTAHLEDYHGYFGSAASTASARASALELRHTALDIALGVLQSGALDRRLTAVQRTRWKRDHDQMLLEHLQEDHMRDHD
jgi:hypothetical protein